MLLYNNPALTIPLNNGGSNYDKNHPLKIPPFSTVALEIVSNTRNLENTVKLKQH
jgi:hypothetical protein